jgi:hypothetical protein
LDTVIIDSVNNGTLDLNSAEVQTLDVLSYYELGAMHSFYEYDPDISIVFVLTEEAVPPDQAGQQQPILAAIVAPIVVGVVVVGAGIAGLNFLVLDSKMFY